MRSTYLVDYNVLPSKLLQMSLLSQNHFVTGNADIEFLINKPIVDKCVALIFGSLKNQNVDLRRPFGKLSLPVVERRFWDRDQMRASDTHDMSQIPEERNSLQSLAQTHLICQNSGY